MRIKEHVVFPCSKSKGLAIVALLLMSFVIPPSKKIRIWLIGDSTVCPYPPSRFPMQGWGMPFAYFFDSTVETKNKALGGRSTRTFIAENRWQPIADSLQEGDYVFMQFGHNDEARQPQYADRYTTPEDYKKNLTRFISETRSKKAIPVLITPVTRMKFDSTGKALPTHEEYSGLMKEVAKQTNTTLIDLDKESLDLLQRLGPKTSKYLYNQLEPGEHPNYPDGIKDNTHFSEFGAREIAVIVLNDIKAKKLELADRIVKPSRK
jgi:lysophospholipase L1-like esterase